MSGLQRCDYTENTAITWISKSDAINWIMHSRFQCISGYSNPAKSLAITPLCKTCRECDKPWFPLISYCSARGQPFQTENMNRCHQSIYMLYIVINKTSFGRIEKNCADTSSGFSINASSCPSPFTSIYTVLPNVKSADSVFKLNSARFFLHKISLASIFVYHIMYSSNLEVNRLLLIFS